MKYYEMNAVVYRRLKEEKFLEVSTSALDIARSNAKKLGIDVIDE